MSSWGDNAIVLVGFLAVLWASAYVFFPMLQRESELKAQQPGRDTELRAKKERFLKSLEELELDIRTRKIAEADYLREKERLLQQVAQCMSELEGWREGSDEPSRQCF